MIGNIAIVVMAVLGIIMFLAPQMCTKTDRRDDPAAVSQVKKLGSMLFLLRYARLCWL